MGACWHGGCVGEDIEGAERSDLTRAFAAAAMAAAGMAAGGPAGSVAAAAAVPYVETLLARVAAELQGKAQLVGEATLDAARAARPEITDDEVFTALIDDPDLLALTMRVMDAAKYTAWPDKLGWLGAVLGRVAVERERLAEHQVLVAVLNDLDPPHALVLETLAEPSPHERAAEQPRAWLLSELVGRLSLEEATVRACIGTLVRHGLARDTRGPLSTEAYDETVLGRAVVAIMHGRRHRTSGVEVRPR